MPATSLNIAVIPGDGIGNEIIPVACEVIDAALADQTHVALTYQQQIMGAQCYADTGVAMSDDTFEAIKAADAILLGAIGLPSIRYPDGTEISPHLRLRDEFQLFAGVRPVKAYPNTPMRLADPRGHDIDFVIVRESTEGLFYSHTRGEVIDDLEALETLRITRATSEKLFDFTFELARRRKSRGTPGRVHCVDKANVFRSMAFFRKIFDERAADFPDVEREYAYVDAMALQMVRDPWTLDVLVMENMFGDILSDLGGGLVGGMGMASCGEIGTDHALFQPAHGSAPDIMGTDSANPIATILSGALMLDWLANRHDAPALTAAAQRIEQAVWDAFASGRLQPKEFGGDHGTSYTRDLVLECLARPAERAAAS